MNYYNYIFNPESGRNVKLNGKVGQKVLANYLNQLGGKPKKLSSRDVSKFNNKTKKRINSARNKCITVYGSMINKMDKKPFMKPKKAFVLLDQLEKNNCQKLLAKGANKVMMMMESDEEYSQNAKKEIRKRKK